MRLTVLERAFELARSGKFASLGDVKRQLKAEGLLLSQIHGRSLTRQLNELCRASCDRGEPRGEQ